jgi:hypothetical protein
VGKVICVIKGVEVWFAAKTRARSTSHSKKIWERMNIAEYDLYIKKWDEEVHAEEDLMAFHTGSRAPVGGHGADEEPGAHERSEYGLEVLTSLDA